jgi:PBP1b-binding outer membrane lipoprotein LpoB
MTRLAQVVLLTLLLSSCKRGVDSYDDCILQNLEAGMNEGLASEIMDSCRNKYPGPNEPGKNFETLPQEDRKLLTGKLVIFANGASGNIYNGTEDWTIEEVTIRIHPPVRDPFADDVADKSSGPFDTATARPAAEKYRVRIHVSPLSSKDFRFDVNWNHSDEHGWIIVDAKGHRGPG